MALNAETEKRWWLLTPELRSDDGSERWNWEVMMALNVETKNVALNVELKKYGDSERWNWEAMMVLNTEIEKRW